MVIFSVFVLKCFSGKTVTSVAIDTTFAAQ